MKKKTEPPTGPVCPRCGCRRSDVIRLARCWFADTILEIRECGYCGRQFSFAREKKGHDDE